MRANIAIDNSLMRWAMKATVWVDYLRVTSSLRVGVPRMRGVTSDVE
jgi:hypothetical protein